MPYHWRIDGDKFIMKWGVVELVLAYIPSKAAKALTQQSMSRRV